VYDGARVAPECLDDNTAAEFASGSLGGAAARRVESHLASCRDCRSLVAALAPIGESDSDIDTSPRHLPPARGKRGRTQPPPHASPALAPTEPRLAERDGAIGGTVGRYVVLGRLGAGGMGVVLSAYDPQLDRKVALKLLRAGSGLHAGEARARLVREAQAIAQLSHPNVVAVYDVGTTASGEVYVAMELVEGETLTQWVRAWERPWRDVLDVFLQAGRGLAAAHGVGLLHRDFKPDNVLVGGDGRVRVTDFGLARSLITSPSEPQKPLPPGLAALRISLTATGAVLGTPRYMAPEQVDGRDADARADQFSFCVALYEALYGRHPLPGGTAVEMVQDRVRALGAPDGKVPAPIGKALARGLEREPARRYPSMSALLGELAPPAARAPGRWLAVGAGVAVVAGGVAFAMVTGDAPPPPGPEPQVQKLLEEVQRELREVKRERDELRLAVARRIRDDQELQRLHDEIARRDAEIDQLRAQAVALENRIQKKPPPPAPTGLVGLSRRAIDEALARARRDVQDCLGEWEGRHPGDGRALQVALTILPDGTVARATAVNLDRDVTVRCAVDALRRQTFPPAAASTSALVTATYGDGVVRLDTSITGYSAAPALIDSVGGAPP